ncbi:MAG: hypothetical protein QG568_295, partial [Patescibacteria group bacterium]|nr:hypothetical protein [Patescibacteria group bacterium]
MRSFLKKILQIFPEWVRIGIVMFRESWWQMIMYNWEKNRYPAILRHFDRAQNKSNKKQIQNILIYHVNGLSHSGTEKNLQLIANGLLDKYSVFFMYSDKTADKSRRDSLDTRINLIPFSYEINEIKVPHRLHDMRPHIKEVISEKNIDLIITASPGYAHYPWNIITEIPIILSNVFGAPSLQKNIATHIFMSETVLKHAEAWTGKRKNHTTQFLPIGKTPPNNVRDLGLKLRTKIGIPESDFVFGRIGRDSDAIFDPIGIRAWQSIAEKYPKAHFLIMSPPDILKNIVANEKIPRVHFIPPSGDEKDIWSFHGALDAMAHFRKDGETSGVAIAESLTVGNPIIT